MNNTLLASAMLNQKALILNPVEQVRPIAKAKETYGFVSTREILDVFHARGWEVESTQINKVRKPEKEGFQRHLIWLKNDNFKSIEGLSKNNQTSPRICLSNSHDMSTALNLFFGLLRCACLNQILAGNVFRYFRASHSKNVLSKLNEGIDFMSEGLPELVEQLRKLQNTTMSMEQRLQYAKTLVDQRLSNVQNVVDVEYSVVEKALRAEDTEQDAYTVMNRVQEYIIRGGIPYTYEKQVKNEAGEVVERRNVSTVTRKLASIPSQLALNQSLVSEIYKVTA